MKRAFFFGLGFLLAAGVGQAASVGEEIRAANGLVSSNSVSRGTWSRYYRDYYIDLCTPERRQEILANCLRGYETLLKIDSKKKSFLHHISLGRAYAAVGRWDDVQREMEEGLRLGDKFGLGNDQRADALFELANVKWTKGDKKGAWELIDKIAALEIKGRPPRSHVLARYLSDARAGNDNDLDVFTLPYHTDGRPFPVPQQEAYDEQTVSLRNVALSVTGLPADAAPARLLRKKLSRFGTTFGAGTPVKVVVSSAAPVDKPQGYSLEVTDAGVTIAARTPQGALWGAVSLVQCVDRENLALRQCRIRDWPTTLRRGTLTGFDPDYLEYALFGKMNSVSFSLCRDWMISPLDREFCRTFARRFREFGIETYCYLGHLTVRPLVPISEERVFRLHLAWSKFLASAGIGVYFPFDDERFPMHKRDLAAAGTAANLDAKYLTRLFRETRKEFPDFRMVFCPPFYWGPEGGVNYPEPRVPYLKSLGEHLDPAIDVYWTGPRVKAAPMTPDQSGWFTKLIGRKPAIFHNGNGCGQHHFCDFGADESGYRHLHGTNLHERISFFHVNTTRYAEAGKAFSAMDWCWNPVGHDAKTAVRRLDEMLEGPGVFEALRKGLPDLSYFDKYQYGEPRCELLTENLADLERKLAVSEEAWSNALARARNGGRFVSGFEGYGLNWARRLVRTLRNPPERLQKQLQAAMDNVRFAKKEVGFDEAAGDQFVPAEVFNGGAYVQGLYDYSKRGTCAAKYVFRDNVIKAPFTCEPFPPERSFTLHLVGKSSSTAGGPKIEVVVNGRSVVTQEMFRAFYFLPVKVEIPMATLKRNNILEIRNVEDRDRTAIIHYAVIKK